MGTRVRVGRSKALLAIGAMVLAGCSGGGGGTTGDKSTSELASIILPSEAPSAAGLPTGPALKPLALVKATDGLDDQAGSSLEAMFAAKSSGFLVTDKVLVAYATANVSGYDPKTGKRLWTADIDMGTGATCAVSQPDSTDIATFTVLYGRQDSCRNLATVSVADGKVVTDVDLGQLAAEDETDQTLGTAEGTMLTIGKTDYLVGTARGLDDMVYAVVDGLPVKQAVLGPDVNDYSPAASAPVLITTSGAHDGDGRSCVVSGYDMPSFTKKWTVSEDAMFPSAHSGGCLLTLASDDGTWVYQEGGPSADLAQLDPQTGAVTGSFTQATDPGAAPEGRPSLFALDADRAVGVDGDLVVPQAGSLMRHSMSRDAVVWRFDATELLVEGVSDDDRYDVRLWPKTLTPDGRYVMATASAAASVEVMAIDAATGKLVGRWPAPAKYITGLTLDPALTVFPGGVALARNFDSDRTAQIDGDQVGVEGSDVYDIGLFTWPKQTKKKDDR